MGNIFLKRFLLLTLLGLSLLSSKPVFAGCSGVTTCKYYGNCSWSNTGAGCQRSEMGNTDPIDGTCECQTLSGASQACSACGTSNGCYEFCGTVGTPFTPSAVCEWTTSTCNWSPDCGNNICEAGESCSSCPSDCTSGCTGCGNDQCDAGENECTCPNDCPGICSGSCSGDAGCNAIANCGVNGWDDASGSCPAGQVCCKSKAGSDTGGCNCCNDAAWVSANYPGWSYCPACPPYDTCHWWDAGYYAGNAHQCAACPCDKQCTPACGQGDACGGTCPNSDGGGPSCPILSSVTPYLDTGTGQVTISWSGSSKAELYNVTVYPRGTTQDCPPINPDAYCSSSQSGTSFSFYPNLSLGNEYNIAIEPINTTCGYELGSICTTDFTIYAPIVVEFYEDDTGSCSSGNPVAPGTAFAGYEAYLSVTDGAGFSDTQTVTSSTTTIYAPYQPSLGNYSVTLDPGRTVFMANDWNCICPQNCQFNGVNSPDGPLEYYLSEFDLSHRGWFQILGGSLFAAQVWPNLAIQNPIPVSTCDADANCTSNVILKDKDTRDYSAGFAVTGRGLIDSSDEGGEQTGYITQRDSQTHIMGNSLKKVNENYNFFARQYKLGLNPTDNSSDFGSPNNSAQKPTTTRDYYYVPGNFNIQEPWTVTTGESYVIFVGGNLLINDDADYLSLIDVEEGGFLAFIVAGHINIAETVGNNDDLDTLASNIEGIFVADGHISIASKGETAGGDERFVGEGIFVGWGGVNLERDFSNGGLRKVENNIRPAETFIYRPDLVVNAPAAMAKPRLIWQESN